MPLNHERSDGSMVGLGISDITPQYRHDLRLVDREHLSVLELQPELDTWKAIHMKDHYRFLAVHASSQGRDIASPDADHRAFALEEHKRGMLFAHLLGADAFLLHAGHIFTPDNVAGIVVEAGYRYVVSYYLEHPEQRNVRAQLFLQSLDCLVDFYQQEDFGFQITVENMPFPNLGATPAEFIDLYRLARLRWPVKLTVDVPHLWVSRLVLRDSPRLRPFVEGYSGLAHSFYDELKRFLDECSDDVLYYHISGVHGFNEHLPINLKKRYRTDELDLRRVAQAIGCCRPIILEVFNATMPQVRRSLHNFRRMLEAA